MQRGARHPSAEGKALRGSLDARTISHLTIVRTLGAGAYGVVYEAIDTRTGNAVAVKELDDRSPSAIARFKHEFRALADFRHPHLVGLKELIEHRGRWLIVMELVPGTDFLEHVRGGADNDNGYDEARLRGALVGVAEGLGALHGYGVLHRDLKPSNVRVRPDGHAVLLDFGLITSLAAGDEPARAKPVGTVAYMAPEQAAGRALTPAADLYALGVCLFEGVTGHLPFVGPDASQLLRDKQRLPAPRASSLAAVPPDLDALCAALLDVDPAARPSAREVARALGRARRGSPGKARAAQRAPFVGREAELTLLERALSRTQEGALQLVLIEGESGVGKSELAVELVRRRRALDPQLAVLRGRCYESEQLSYKAFDGCVDELARLLAALPRAQSDALLPQGAGLLGDLFPVLRQVSGVARAREAGHAADPIARRLEAFAALAELLATLAAARPLVLVIDDLQWADPESFRLLGAIVQHHPSPALLIAATVRPRAELEPEVRVQIELLRSAQHTEVLPVVGLPRAQAHALAGPLLGSDAPPRALAQVAEESQGHPLFMIELAEYARRHNFGPHLKISLEAALRARIERLHAGERDLLELVALAARPYPVNVFAEALGVRSLDEPAGALIAAKLLRERRGHELGCFHDRIRHAAVGLVARARLPALHRKLATALRAASAVDPSEQARHWELAGAREEALEAYERAVVRASDGLAFRHAAQLAARALELLGEERSERAQALMVQRAHALGCAGFAGESAALYERASAHARGDARLKLRASAAGALLVSAEVGRGLPLAREVMRELGLRVPSGLFGILLRFAWDTLIIRLSLRGRVPRDDAPSASHPARERLLLELTRELSMGVSTVHPMLLPATTSQRGRLALRVGTRSDIACVYAELGWITAVTRSRAAAEPLWAESRRLIQRSQDPLARVLQAYAEGSGRLAVFDMEGARACLERASSLCQQHLASRPFLLASIRYHLGILWMQTRDFWRIAREAEGWILEARERNDVLCIALLVGHGRGFLRHLMRDEPAAAHAELDEAMRPIPDDPLSFAHFGYAWAKIVTFSYEGDGTGALRFLDAFEARHRGAFLLRSKMGREAMTLIRAYALSRVDPHADADPRGARARQRKRTFGSLRRMSSPMARGLSALFAAEDALRAGQRERARALARVARPLLEPRDRPSAYSAFLGLLEGGASGRARYEAALRDSQQQGYKRPERALAMAVGSIALLRDAPPGAPIAGLLAQRYEVTAALGGGFGDMVSARDVRTDRVVALRELVPEGRTSLERFKQQYRLLATLHHPNLVQLESLFEAGGRWYITTELVQGEPLLDYVRPAGTCDVARVRMTFAGLARGLRVLHASGLVHRNVAPANVLVTAEGRTVLVDFALVARAGEAREAGAASSLVHAAPEQLRGAPLEPSADVYALGVCLYEALTGAHPFGEGDPQQLLLRKERGVGAIAARPELGPLGALCERALAGAPAARPGLDEILYLLEHAAEAPPVGARPIDGASASDEALVGRADELAALEAATVQSPEAGLTLTLVEGASGVGKSAIARELARRAALRTPAPWILRGRCYEAEQIACKAFDLAVDQLAGRLSDLPEAACDALMPPQAALLAQLFPVLHGVPAVARAPRKGLPAEPAARRQAGHACFVALLERLCLEVPLCFVLDDLQWADPESFALLDALMERAPTLPLSVVATVRPRSELTPDVRARMARLQEAGRTHTLTLAPLPPRDARALACALLGGTPTAGDAADAIARESGGHPLFLRELVVHERQGLDPGAGHRTLEAALRARIGRLTPEARRLLALVALTDKPYGTHVYARAMGSAELPRDALIALLQQDLLRRRGADGLTTTHHHVQRAARALVDAAEHARSAAALAAALRTEPGVDPAECGELWEQAGAVEDAIAAYADAAERALDGLAFARAAQHFARALALLGDARDARALRLTTGRGHALARAGQSADAARAFAQAAQLADGEGRMRLSVLEARHLIQSGQVDEGLRAGTALLRSLGIAVPIGERAALARIGWERVRVRLLGTSPAARATTPAAQLRLDALQGLAAPLSFASYLTGFTVMAQYLRHALRAGESSHVARALAYEGLWRSMRQPEREATGLFERAAALAEQVSDPALRAQVAQIRGLSSLARTQYAEAVAHLVSAHDTLNTRCPGEPWLLTTTRMHLGFAWWTSGAFGTLREHAGTWMDEAAARDDRCAVAALSGFGGACLRHLFVDDLAAARAELARVMEGWPREPFTLLHFGALVARHLLLTVAPPGPQLEEALDGLERERSSQAYLLRAPTADAAYLAGRCAVQLRALDAARPSARLIARVRDDLAALRGMRAPLALSASAWFEAVLHVVDGQRERARAAFHSLVKTRPAVAIHGGYGASYALGLLEAGAPGVVRCNDVLARIAKEGWRTPRLGLLLRAPAIDLVERLCGRAEVTPGTAG